MTLVFEAVARISPEFRNYGMKLTFDLKDPKHRSLATPLIGL